MNLGSNKTDQYKMTRKKTLRKAEKDYRSVIVTSNLT